MEVDQTGLSLDYSCRCESCECGDGCSSAQVDQIVLAKVDRGEEYTDRKWDADESIDSSQPHSEVAEV